MLCNVFKFAYYFNVLGANGLAFAAGYTVGGAAAKRAKVFEISLLRGPAFFLAFLQICVIERKEFWNGNVFRAARKAVFTAGAWH